MKKRILIVCNDVIGRKMAGPAIRCTEIAKQLAKKHSISLSTPAIQEHQDFGFETFEVYSSIFQKRVLEADIIIIQGDALRTHPFLKHSSAVLIADLYCPIPLEYHQSSAGVDNDIRAATDLYLADVLSEQLAYADHFICASERQRNYWLGALTAAGRMNSLRWPDANHANVDDLISLVPFGLADSSPKHEKSSLREMFNIPKDDFVLIWGGGIYEWFDPLTIIHAIYQLTQSGHKIHLAFIGVKHPNPGIEQHDMCAKALKLSNELGLNGKYVHFNFGWVDYNSRHNFLLDANIGVSAHYKNPETIFSFRTRMLDYLWCGLPIVATKGDVFGDSLIKEECGISVDYESIDDWVLTLDRIIKNPDLLYNLQNGSKRYSEKFRWSSIALRFSDNLLKITHAPDRDFIRTNKNPIGISKSSLIQRLKSAYSRGGISAIFRAIIRKVRKHVQSQN